MEIFFLFGMLAISDTAPLNDDLYSQSRKKNTYFPTDLSFFTHYVKIFRLPSNIIIINKCGKTATLVNAGIYL